MAYKPEIFNLIIDRIEQSESLRSILKDIHVSQRTFFEWIENDKELEKQYARAMELRYELKFESIESDYMEQPQRDPESGRIDSAWVALQRLKIDAKKWELSKLMPKKYGDRMEVDNKLSGSVTMISLGSGKKPDESDS